MVRTARTLAPHHLQFHLCHFLPTSISGLVKTILLLGNIVQLEEVCGATEHAVNQALADAVVLDVEDSLVFCRLHDRVGDRGLSVFKVAEVYDHNLR